MTERPDGGAFDLEQEVEHSKTLKSGSEHYRAYVGPAAQYDYMGATQFRLLTGLGLREEHHLLDIGCGSLRAGKFLIQYLLPGRYTGVEPNEWLWKSALRREIGEDVVGLKRPRFVSHAGFDLDMIDTANVDFAVAQSIYSHAGADAVMTSMRSVARVLRPSGQFFFTALTETSPGYGKIPFGRDIRGWTYPPCTCFPADELIEMSREAGLCAQVIRWFHPRQTWFQATLHPDLLLTPEMQAEMGSGRPLYDSRFQPA